MVGAIFFSAITIVSSGLTGVSVGSRLHDVDKETTKFITGIRSPSHLNNFLSQLKSAGLDAWKKPYTTQYQRFKSPKTLRPQA